MTFFSTTFPAAPKFTDFFRSYYIHQTHLQPVDINEEWIARHSLMHIDQKAYIVAQKLMSNPELRKALCEPPTSQKQIDERISFIRSFGFRLLSVKEIPQSSPISCIPFYSVIEHNALPNWIIKTCAIYLEELRITPLFHKKYREITVFKEGDDLLRIAVAERIRKVIKKADLDNVVIPKKGIVPYGNGKYFILCEKLDLLAPEEFAVKIMGMDEHSQRDIAKKISILIIRVGLIDPHLQNIRLTTSGKLTIIDTEPMGLMVRKKPLGIVSQPTTCSVEKCARIGLSRLIEACYYYGLKTTPFYFELMHSFQTIDNDTLKLSKMKIGFSIASLGIIPIINAIKARCRKKSTEIIFKQTQTLDQLIQSTKASLPPCAVDPVLEKLYQDIEQQFQTFLISIENVPYIDHAAEERISKIEESFLREVFDFYNYVQQKIQKLKNDILYLTSLQNQEFLTLKDMIKTLKVLLSQAIEKRDSITIDKMHTLLGDLTIRISLFKNELSSPEFHICTLLTEIRFKLSEFFNKEEELKYQIGLSELYSLNVLFNLNINMDKIEQKLFKMLEEVRQKKDLSQQELSRILLEADLLLQD